MPLDERELSDAAFGLVARGVDALAVCFLHAYKTPRTKRGPRKYWPGCSRMCRSSRRARCCRRSASTERASTTVMAAYLAPLVGRYLSHLESYLADRAAGAPLFIMQSAGGILPSAGVRARPVDMLQSGPAARSDRCDETRIDAGRPPHDHARYGRDEHRRVSHRQRRRRRLHAEGSGRTAGWRFQPRHRKRRIGRRQHRLDRSWRHAASRPPECRREAWAGLLCARRRRADDHRRVRAPWLDPARTISGRTDAARPRSRARRAGARGRPARSLSRRHGPGHHRHRRRPHQPLRAPRVGAAGPRP